MSLPQACCEAAFLPALFTLSKPPACVSGAHAGRAQALGTASRCGLWFFFFIPPNLPSCCLQMASSLSGETHHQAPGALSPPP